MKKGFFQFCAIFICAFISALFGADYVLDKIWDDDYVSLAVDDLDARGYVMFALSNKEALDENDLDKVYRNSCTFLTYRKYLYPEDYGTNPSFQMEQSELQKKAAEAEKDLRDRNLCH